ncbi:MAG: M50 family metallopeptidase [Anaerolineae bacterium]|nr:M50 family metallopeptidase [Anaerolineae bacterium]
MDTAPSGEPAAGASRGLWETLAENIAAAPEPATDLWASLENRLDFSRRKPRRAAQVEVVRQAGVKGDSFYILRNAEANTYLKIDAQDYFLWQHLDGEHSVRDLAVAYFAAYRAFPFDRLVQLLDQLKAKQLLEDRPIHVLGGIALRLEERTLAYRMQRFADTSMQKEFSLKNVDRLFAAMYRRLAWPLFTRPGLIVCGLVALTGLVLFVRLLLSGTYSVVQTAGSYGLGLLVLLLANYTMIFFHESGHALTCKHYGRSILKGGMLFYYGSPAFFVDTTDIWMAPKAARVATSFAGPAADLAVGGMLVLVSTLFSQLPVSAVLFQMAAVAYLGVLLNLAPFMELDGYFILMDWLEIPLLRKKSLAFVRKRLVSKLLREHTPFSREERILAIYGLLTGAFTVLTMFLSIYLWQSQVRGLIETVLSGRDILSAVLAGGLALLAGVPLILGLLVRVILLADAGLARLREKR